jgi:hypothetical protein
LQVVVSQQLMLHSSCWCMLLQLLQLEALLKPLFKCLHNK